MATGRKVCLATTAYENPDAAYTFSIQRSREALHQAGVPTAYFLLSGNCHVDDARNVVVHEFLLSDCTELVFLDADVSWHPDQLLKLLDPDVDVVGGVYPYRRQSTRGAMPVRLLDQATQMDDDGLIEVDGLPAGFLRIKRHVLERMAETSQRYWHRGDRRAQVPILFERSFEDGIRWGGDLNFCNKWRALGGKLHCLPELVLGHTAKIVVRDSLAAVARREAGATLRYMVERLSDGHDTAAIAEAQRYRDNPFGASLEGLTTCAALARRADGPILDVGSGLSTIVMAAVSDHQVFAIEHDPIFAGELERMAKAAGTRIALCAAPIKNGWYDLSAYPDLPERFALAFVDGPPRRLGSRRPFFTHFGDRVDDIIVDDVDQRDYGNEVEAWALAAGRQAIFLDERLALIRRNDDAPTEHGAAREAAHL